MDELEARLVPGTEQSLTNPFFSPDGQSVGYFQDGQLKRIAVSGGAPVVIASGLTNPFGASWAADDTILVGQPEGILRVPATGGTPELVIATAEGEAVDGPQLLPGGDSVLFSATTAVGDTRWDQAQIVVQSLSTGERTVVVQGGSDPRYVPTGHLVYALEDDLFGVDFDAASLAVEGRAVPLVQGVQRVDNQAGNAATANYGVSDQGTLAYLADTASDSLGLVWVSRDGANERIDTIPAGTTPRLSPDGERMLVEAGGDLWVYDIATGRSSRVTRDGSTARGAWDPTGVRVAYTSGRAGDEQIWVQPADGSAEAQQLTDIEGGRVHADSWSPDGRTLSVHQHLGVSVNIMMIPVAGQLSEPQEFLLRESNDGEAVFSPDGRYVAYRSDETGQREIYIRPYPGPGGQVTVSVGGGQQPVWADNGELFYRDLDGQRMMVVPVATEPTLTVGTPRQLFQGTYYNLPPGGSPRPQYDVTADGQRLLMLEVDEAARPRIIVVQNFFEELRRLVPTD